VKETEKRTCQLKVRYLSHFVCSLSQLKSQLISLSNNRLHTQGRQTGGNLLNRGFDWLCVLLLVCCPRISLCASLCQHDVSVDRLTRSTHCACSLLGGFHSSSQNRLQCLQFPLNVGAVAAHWLIALTICTFEK
jgi:hypothetical protein